jgi:hypothetical protein
MRARTKKIGLVVGLGVFACVWLAGCSLGGGGGGNASTTSTQAGATVTTSSGSRPGKVTAQTIVGTKLKPTKQTPQEVTQALTNGAPIVVLFYVPGNPDDAAVVNEVQTLQPTFPDYTFLLFDYKQPDAYGDLSGLLQVNYPPELIFIDRSGIVRQTWNGFADEATINQLLVNLNAS